MHVRIDIYLTEQGILVFSGYGELFYALIVSIFMYAKKIVAIASIID